MSVTLQRPTSITPSINAGDFPEQVLWTRKDYYRLLKRNLVDQRTELIDGLIISKLGQQPPHAYVIRMINAWLTKRFDPECVCIQLPIRVSPEDNVRSDPSPDAAVTGKPAEYFQKEPPGPADLDLVIEVADTTLRFDLGRKALMYARAGIADYWVIDITGRRVIVHRQPNSDWYADVMAYSEEESVAPLVSGEAAIMVAELFPTP